MFGTKSKMGKNSVILFVQERPIEILPPVVSLLRCLKDMGERVCFIGMVRTETGLRTLKTIGVEFDVYPYWQTLFKERPLYRTWQKITSRIRPYLYRAWVWRKINAFLSDNDSVLLWSSEMSTAAILGDKALKFGKKHIQSLYELGDEAGKDYVGFDISALYKSATLIECEYNRAHILMAEKQLMRLPFILPNKPYFHPRKRNLRISYPNVAEIVETWKGKRVFIYQGAIQNDRGKLLLMIESLCRSQPDAIVAIMGRKVAAIEALKKRFSNVCYVPFVPPPYHLEITSHADVGIAYYQGGAVYGLSPLNPVYCAPNKIYEYAGFGMPVICNDVPGLKYTIGRYEAGVCLNQINDDAVASATKQLLLKYDDYSCKASKFYESIDIASIVKSVLDYARN